MDIRERFHGVPLYGWYVGSGVLAGTSYILWRRHKAKLTAAAAAQGKGSGSATSVVGLSPDMQAPIPGWAGLSSALGGLGGSSPTGPLTGYDTYGVPVYGLTGDPSNIGITPTPVPAVPIPADPQPVPVSAPAAPVVAAAPPSPPEPPQDSYYVGQVVNPNSGEKVVQNLFSKLYGWLNLTSLGGIYQGVGAPNPLIGSYLGYAATTPNPAGEVAVHGKFGSGGLSLLPGGGYRETNLLGENYNFGS